MTAARFDLLCLIRQKAIWGSREPKRDMLTAGASQSQLRARLDIHRSTISKMLTRLEEMGWIRRTKSTRDRRTKMVYLTALGLRRIWHAMRIVFRDRFYRKRFERIAKLACPWEKDPRVTVDAKLDDIDFIAACFGDQSRVEYEYGFGREVTVEHHKDPPVPHFDPITFEQKNVKKRPVREWSFGYADRLKDPTPCERAAEGDLYIPTRLFEDELTRPSLDFDPPTRS